MAILTLRMTTLILIATVMVQGRLLRLNSSDDPLISDGFNHVENHGLYHDSFSSSSSFSNDQCEHVYGFFPCADNIGGYLLLIIVYQYFMVVGEKLVTKGSTRIFNILGTGIFGASAFRILLVLPSLAMMIVSGIFATQEDAQNQVSLGVSVYAGSTIFSLTLLWGACVIFGRKEMPQASSPNKETPEAKSSTSHSSAASKPLLLKKNFFNYLNDTGITTDVRTRHTAGIMLLSLIPFLIVQLVNIFSTSSGIRIVILVALLASITLLLAYFIYQILDPWIQERSLKYSKYENLLAGFLQHVQRHAKGKLIGDDGSPNITVMKRLFAETDTNDDKSLTLQELESLILSIVSDKVNIEMDYAVSEILKAFDLDNDKRIGEDEFINGCTKWINDAKNLPENGDSRTKKLWHEIIEPFTKKKKEEISNIERLMARILKHVESQALEGLLNDDGSPNIERIKSLFNKFDSDHNKHISQSELEELIKKVKFGDQVQLNHAEAVKKLMQDFDKDGNNVIDEDEFIHGMAKWLNEAIRVANCKDKRRSIDEFDKITWEEVDKLLYEVKQNGSITDKLTTWAFNKSVFEVILGVVILTFLARPLVMSILQLSIALQIQSLFVSFVIVPIAMNGRRAISAIFPASHKSEKTASLTFSEIYGGVIMNNVMGLVTLLAIIYAKNLTWDYSAEVLIILVVCAIVGLFSFLRTTYPLWTIFFAFFLYPFSLVMFYVQQIWGWK